MIILACWPFWIYSGGHRSRFVYGIFRGIFLLFRTCWMLGKSVFCRVCKYLLRNCRHHRLRLADWLPIPWKPSVFLFWWLLWMHTLKIIHRCYILCIFFLSTPVISGLTSPLRSLNLHSNGAECLNHLIYFCSFWIKWVSLGSWGWGGTGARLSYFNGYF